MELGPELVVNGKFDVNADGWTPTVNVSVAAISGRLRVTTNFDIAHYANQQISGLVVGQTYRVSAKLYGGTAAAVFRVGTGTNGVVGSVAVKSAGIGGSALLDVSFVAAATSYFLVAWSNRLLAGSFAEFDDISLRLVLPTPSGRIFSSNRTTQFSRKYDIRRFIGRRRS